MSVLSRERVVAEEKLPRRLLDTKTVAKILGVHLRTVQREIRAGSFREVVWLGSSPRIPAEIVRRYQDDRTERTPTKRKAGGDA